MIKPAQEEVKIFFRNGKNIFIFDNHFNEIKNLIKKIILTDNYFAIKIFLTLSKVRNL